MANPASSKKQIIESIKDKKSILVTVSDNPSVDELAAALGLTIFLNKLDKHATAIASGDIPSALDFLDPEKTFEATADSLRDFIIALDKDKADHLRYKLEGDVVKIFITPYRTTITQSDLEFSQGDYNVEMVLALNVANNDQLDRALSAHGKILHDATVATISIGDTKSSLGTIEWHEDKVSGISEMVTEIIQELKTAKADIDEQIATALLTGIVASTDRFSNDLTSSKVMTMSAELMASGANQQLIASKLQSGEEAQGAEKETSQDIEQKNVQDSEPEEQAPEPVDEDPTKLSIDRSGEGAPVAPPAATEHLPAESVQADEAVVLDHGRVNGLDEVAKQVREQSQQEAAQAAEAQLSQLVEPVMAPPAVVAATEVVADAPLAYPAAENALPPVIPTEMPLVVPSITQELEQATEQINADHALPAVGSEPVVENTIISKAAQADATNIPAVGGTLNATTAAAAEAKRDEATRDQNRTILTHGKPLASADQPMTGAGSPMNAAMATQQDEPPAVDIFAAPPASPSGMAAPEAGPAGNAINPLAQPAPEAHQSAMADVQAALATPADQAANAVPGVAPTLADIEAEVMPSLPPMPDFNSLPPLPPAPFGMEDINGLPPLPSAPPTPPANQEFNPAQFQIPQQ